MFQQLSPLFFSRLSRLEIKFIDPMNRIDPRNTKSYDYVIDEAFSSE